MNTVTYEFNMKAFKKAQADTALAEFNKKAEKLGCEPVQMSVIKEYVTRQTRDGSVITASTLPENIVEIPMLTMELTGSIPKLGDYDVVGYTEALPTGNIVTNILQDDSVNLVEYRDRITCDHCGHNRNRLYTWILRKRGDTKLFQVGTTCVKDYTGHDPYKIIRVLTWFNEICGNMEDEEFGMGGGGYRSFNVVDWIAYVLFLMEDHKLAYVSYSKARDRFDLAATDSILWECVLARNADERPYDLEPNKDQLSRAKDIYNWALAHDDSADYWYNVTTLLKLAEGSYGYLSAKYSGYIASLPAAFHRETAKSEQKSEHVGQLKEKLEFEAVLFNVFGFDGAYGFVEYYLFKDADGNVFKWKTSSCPTDTNSKFLEKNHTYKLKGTVKAHSVYKEIKQTDIVRVKAENLTGVQDDS